VPQQPDPGYDIVGDLRVVLAHIVLPSIDDRLRAGIGSAARIDKCQDMHTASMREYLRSKRGGEWSDLITLTGISDVAVCKADKVESDVRGPCYPVTRHHSKRRIAAVARPPVDRNERLARNRFTVPS
jgi:hypothetical protein